MIAQENPAGEVTLAALADKLDQVLEFQAKLEPYLPMLEKLTAAADNPAMRFLARSKR